MAGEKGAVQATIKARSAADKRRIAFSFTPRPYRSTWRISTAQPGQERGQKAARRMRDPGDMRRAEMDREQQRIVLGATLQQLPARHRRILRPLVRGVVPMRRIDLQRMVNDVAAEYCA